MSRLYDTIGPSVITENMLEKSVKEYGPKGEAGRIAELEGLPLKKVETLKLSFNNILEIDNLIWFENLTKLQLDNNIIEKIENISHLTKLKWLDLSFNNIEFIEGIETLKNLEDLTLFHNRILKIENLETLQNLQVLSIGNNLLQNLEDIKYLRQLKSLKAVNIKGNPFCEKDEFRTFVLAFLPDIVYLDYKMINEDERSNAYQRLQMQVETLRADEIEKEKKQQEMLEQEKREALYTEAFINGLDGNKLFEMMFEDDVDGMCLRELSKNNEHAMEFMEKCAEHCKTLFDFGLVEFNKRKEEVAAFTECLEEAKLQNKETGISLIEKFVLFQTKLFMELPKDEEDEDEMKNSYKTECNALKNQLMCLEMQLVDQIEEAVTEFGRNMDENVQNFTQYVSDILNKCRELVNIYRDKVSQEAAAVQEKINKGDPIDDISDELRAKLIDKESMENALGTSQSTHIAKIDKLYDDITAGINDWLKDLKDRLEEREEIERNRERVLEISLLVDNFEKELEMME